MFGFTMFGSASPDTSVMVLMTLLLLRRSRIMVCYLQLLHVDDSGTMLGHGHDGNDHDDHVAAAADAMTMMLLPLMLLVL